MYDLALTVAACLRAGTAVHVAWVVDAAGPAGAVPTGAAIAFTPGGGRVGSVGLASLDDELADLCTRGVGDGRLVVLGRSPAEAGIEDVTPTVEHVRCVAVPADRLAPDLWVALLDREVVGLATHLDGDEVRDVRVVVGGDAVLADDELAGPARRRRTGAAADGDVVATVLWPVARLLVAGGGLMAEALADAARLLGWQVDTTADRRRATGAVAALAPLDRVVVVGHDVELAGSVLEAALDGRPGYIGSVGPRSVQQERREWLARRGITDLARVHGPAGLDIGASTPAEVAVAVLAEAIAVTGGGRG